MEFEELKKIWDTQNNEPMYAINESALHRRILTRKNKTRWLANINEIGLMIIAILTGGILLTTAIVESKGMFSYLAAITLPAIGIYVLARRLARKKEEKQFDRSMLGELDHAIANATYLANFSKTFVWWFLLPAAITTFLNMSQADPSWWKWLLIAGCFCLAYFIVRWEYRRCHLPRVENLKSLRAKLAEGQ